MWKSSVLTIFRFSSLLKIMQFSWVVHNYLRQWCRHATIVMFLSYFGTLQVSLLHERECVDAHRGAEFATRRSDRFLPRSRDKRRTLFIKMGEFHTEAEGMGIFFRDFCGVQLQRFCGSSLIVRTRSHFLSLSRALHTTLPWAPREHVAVAKGFIAATPVAPIAPLRVSCAPRINLTNMRNATLFCQLRATELHTGVHVRQRA